MKVVAKINAIASNKLLRTGAFALIAVAAFLAPVHACAEGGECPPGDAQLYFESINRFMQLHGREGFAWNDALAAAAEKVAALNSRKGNLQKLSDEDILGENEYDMRRFATNATMGGDDVQDAFQQHVPEYQKFLTQRYFKDAATACVPGKDGPYRAVILGLLKTDVPEDERFHCAPGFAHAVLAYTNDYRALLHLEPLAWSDQLAAAAEKHADYMAEIDNAQHEGRDGAALTERVKAEGYDYHWVLENVASGQEDPLKVVLEWRASPHHDENLRNPNVKDMGAACADRAHTTHQIFWVQDFGERR